jgi:hypothetical protein
MYSRIRPWNVFGDLKKSQKSHVEFFLEHMLSLGVTLSLPSLEMAKS